MPTYLRNDKFVKQFARRLRRLRRSKDLTISQLSELSGIQANYIARIERALVNTSISHVYFLAKALKVKPQDMFAFDEEEFK
jgi:transcriptional regulator with XRE-family HTH domain